MAEAEILEQPWHIQQEAVRRTAGEPSLPVTAAGSSGRGWAWRRGSETEHPVLLDGPARTTRPNVPRITAPSSQGPFRKFARCVTYGGAGTFQTSPDGQLRP
jgi:hypothetical protein